jgi:hypothetical protein
MCAACGVTAHVPVLDPDDEPLVSPNEQVKFAALRNPTCRVYLVGGMLSMMADNIEHVITYWVLWQTFRSTALTGFEVIGVIGPVKVFREVALLLVIGGICNLAAMSITQTVAQLLAPRAKRGQVVGVYSVSANGLRMGNGGDARRGPGGSARAGERGRRHAGHAGRQRDLGRARRAAGGHDQLDGTPGQGRRSHAV